MTPWRRAAAATWLAVLSFGAACASPAPIQLAGLDGGLHEPATVAAGHVHVLVFTSHECPIANSYAPVLRDLAASWSTAPVRLFLIHVDPDLSLQAALEHARAFELPGTIVLDPEQRLARTFGATKTPEAVVLTAAGPAYRGRIDDQWQALGQRTQAAEHHDLRDAVTAALAGRTVPLPHPPAIGCLLPEPRR